MRVNFFWKILEIAFNKFIFSENSQATQENLKKNSPKYLRFKSRRKAAEKGQSLGYLTHSVARAIKVKIVKFLVENKKGGVPTPPTLTMKNI